VLSFDPASTHRVAFTSASSYLLDDGGTFTGLGGCELIVLPHEEAERVADNDCLSWVKDVEAPSRTFDLEKIGRWAFDNG
jgi:hypothetical protein